MSDSDNYDDERNGLWFWIPLILILIVLFFIVRSCSNDSQLWQSSSEQSSTEISETPGKTLDNAVNAASDQLQNASKAIGDTAVSASNSVKSAASNIGDTASNISQSVKDSASGAADSLSDTTRQTMTGAKNLADSATSKTGEVISGAANTAKQTAQSTLQTGTSAATAAADITRDTLNKSLDGLKNIPAGVINNDVLEILKSGKLRSGEVYSLATLQFNSAQSAISEADKSKLQTITQIIQAYPNAMIQIHGHSDSSGPEDFNQTLSTQRAETVKQRLIKMGVADRQIEIQGHGSSQPVASNDTSQGRQKNRRIEIVLQQ